MQRVFACRFVSATGAVAEQDVVASAWGFVQTQGIKLDCRFYLADRQAEMRGDLADSLVGAMQELLLELMQNMQQVVGL